MYSHLPHEFNMKWQSFCIEFQRSFDKQKQQPGAKIIFESIICASGEQFKTLALRIEQMARNAYVNNAPHMQNTQMIGGLDKALDRQIVQIVNNS